MGTEVFPVILTFIKIVVGTIIVIALMVIIANGVVYFRNRQGTKKREQAHEMIINALITLIIALIAYFVFSAIGPAFRIIF